MITNNNFCSIIMVTYRRGNHNRDAMARMSIASLLENTTAPYELILIDNTENNRGLGAARNEGIKQATGNCIAIVDDDILFRPGWLQACLEIIAINPVDFIATPIHVENKKRAWWKKWYRGEVHGYLYHMRSGSNCMVMSRELCQRLGDFPNIHPRVDGVKYHDRICRAGIQCLLTKEPLALDAGLGKHSY